MNYFLFTRWKLFLASLMLLVASLIIACSSGDSGLYYPSGSLDRSFGADGFVTTNFGGGIQGSIYDLDVQPDGRIVAAGWYFTGANYYFALARYNSDGTLDTTFGGGDGIVTTDIAGSGISYSSCLAIQDDGKIVAGGWYQAGASDYDFALARYNADGSLDATFGTGGIVITDMGTHNDFIRDLGIQSDGKIVVAG